MSIDPGKPEYVWRQAADVIAARIAAGDYSGRLPSEGDLARDHGVGKNTVRRALVDLRERGLVVTLPQRGTFVATPARRDEK